MKVTRLRLKPWSTSEATGVQHAQLSWTDRGGLLLELESDEGLVGRGEASPLPGYSLDRLEDCDAALRSLDPTPWALPAEPQQLESAWREIARELPTRLPAASCAIEMALADLYAKSAGIPLWKLLSSLPSSLSAPPPTPRGVAALLSEAAPDALQSEASHRVAEGYRALKLKSSGTQPLDLELQRWRAARAVAEAHRVPLRLDANQTWPEEALDRWLGAATEVGIEFVEEPIPFHRPWRGPRSPVPIALDESLALIDAWPNQDGLELRNVRVLVIKPMMLGLHRSLEVAAWARSQGFAVVVTHTFEGAYGYALGLALALAVGSPSYAHGLAPHSVLAARWPDVTFESITGGRLGLSTQPGLGFSDLCERAP